MKNAGKRSLNVLIVEDSENDAALLELELERAGYSPFCQRVETRDAMLKVLKERRWDVVIADYIMPHFNGLAALGLVRELGLDLPFIVVSGHITDDTAVAAMKAGAHDYVMKDNLARLGAAVDRELREAEVRLERRQAEDRLKVESAFRAAIENSVPSGITAVDLDGRQTYVNRAFCEMVGWSDTDLIGKFPPFAYWPPEDVETMTNALSDVVAGQSTNGMEWRFRRRTQERIHVLVQITPLRDNFANITGWVSSVSDITERKHAEIRLAAEHAITRILANAQSIEEGAPGIVQVLLDALEVEVGTLWLVDPKHQVLNPFQINTRTLATSLKGFLEETRRVSLSQGEDIPGKVWSQRRSVWIPDVGEEKAFRRGEACKRADLRTLMAFPVQNAGDFVGVLEFLTIRTLQTDATLMNMMSAIGSEIGQFLRRRAAEEALRRAHDELELRVQQRTAELASANSKLHASILDRKRLEHELLEITEQERRRIGLDLHDDLGQKLSGIALMTKGLQLKLERQKLDAAAEAERIHTLVQEAMNHASDLAHDLATLDLPEKTLPTALQHLAEHARELFKISCQFKSQGEVPTMDSNMVHQLYKIAQEALTNAIKHGKARKVQIGLKRDNEFLNLTVQNDGVPFPDLHARNTGMGLRIMSYRSSLLGGTLDIKAAGTRGTLLTCVIPAVVKK